MVVWWPLSVFLKLTIWGKCFKANWHAKKQLNPQSYSIHLHTIENVLCSTVYLQIMRIPTSNGKRRSSSIRRKLRIFANEDAWQTQPCSENSTELLSFHRHFDNYYKRRTVVRSSYARASERSSKQAGRTEPQQQQKNATLSICSDVDARTKNSSDRLVRQQTQQILGLTSSATVWRGKHSKMMTEETSTWQLLDELAQLHHCCFLKSNEKIIDVTTAQRPTATRPKPSIVHTNHMQLASFLTSACPSNALPHNYIDLLSIKG